MCGWRHCMDVLQPEGRQSLRHQSRGGLLRRRPGHIGGHESGDDGGHESRTLLVLCYPQSYATELPSLPSLYDLEISFYGLSLTVLYFMCFVSFYFIIILLISSFSIHRKNSADESRKHGSCDRLQSGAAWKNVQSFWFEAKHRFYITSTDESAQ